ncbi:YoaK family protein [Paradevosia shaoguanensis]|jgi:uncharacterized membrane protein YoaK (UPF0700 family)|uniref:DUF1275 domain-containing protein n=1 Tax=Paradevosia shaoguanensis TaxID=1335043 RepID=A0AA41QIX7_9HYPH|nr:YoaK family protein [Paradevosia shaoguanensis]KFL25019.1 transmembrane protein [Devosia sp. 17-2-E-8]MBI4048901.1 DUF1275 domain-containing protein [Devosia nanyangense]QMV03739.1 DUF1275 domain-containing protein [Devosia sp. D6-9]CDP53296.1 Probable transmembrane protein [Devosia sp. DBB001]MCF1740819.1 DUF1275 domain-containing protein [Paradevosia shaoguanensis]
MLIKEGDERTVAVDVRLASILAGVAGAVNAAGFHAIGYYSANMTGNVSALSDYIASGNFRLALLYGGIVIAFISGAWASSLMINYGRRRKAKAVYAYSVLTEGTLLALFGLADLWLPGIHRSVVLIIGLSFLMGLQNASATRISNARVRTTHVSGMATDVGIELATLFDIKRGVEPEEDWPANRSRLRLHTTTILAFVFGGIAGVLLYGYIAGAMLVGAGILLVSIAVPEIHKTRRR